MKSKFPLVLSFFFITMTNAPLFWESMMKGNKICQYMINLWRLLGHQDHYKHWLLHASPNLNGMISEQIKKIKKYTSCRQSLGKKIQYICIGSHLKRIYILPDNSGWNIDSQLWSNSCDYTQTKGLNIPVKSYMIFYFR